MKIFYCQKKFFLDKRAKLCYHSIKGDEKMIKLDYTIESPEERKKLVEEIIAETPDLNSGYLEILADYLILCMEKQEKKEKKILTENRLTTVNKRETSFEGLVGKMESGEDGVYNLITDNNKNAIFQPKISITKKDLEEIPFLRQLRDTISIWEEKLKQSSGKDAYTIKKALIEMRKDQYLIKQAYKRPIVSTKIMPSSHAYIHLDDDSYLTDKGEIIVEGISLMNHQIISLILCNYSELREEAYGRFEADTWYLVQAFDEIATKALRDYPLYERLVELKVDGVTNAKIKEILAEEFGISYSLEYISSLWRNKIPKMIAQTAKEEYLIWESKNRNIKLKKCSRCNQLKPANNIFFSKNNTAKDGFYSLCKQCRSEKTRKGK